MVRTDGLDERGRPCGQRRKGNRLMSCRSTPSVLEFAVGGRIRTLAAVAFVAAGTAIHVIVDRNARKSYHRPPAAPTTEVVMPPKARSASSPSSPMIMSDAQRRPA